MSESYRVFGAELSPYSVKVRSYFRFKGLPHRWILRNPDTQEEFQRYAKMPLIPLVVTPDDRGLQDSTPIIETVEAGHPEPSIVPDDATAAFVSALVEEFGDEWGNKWMFHYRWAREVDQQSGAGRLARMMMPDGDDETCASIAEQIRDRMTGRVWFVGSSEQTAPQIEASFRDGVAQLEAHLATRPYLFGARPSLGDFGLWGQLYNAWTDPTPGAIVGGGAPNVLAWIHRMTWPRIDGDFEPWADLEPTLAPFLEQHVGRLFLPWSVANAEAIAAGDEEFTVVLDGKDWTQKPQKYHAKSLAALRAKYAAIGDKTDVAAALERVGCLGPLAD